MLRNYKKITPYIIVLLFCLNCGDDLNIVSKYGEDAEYNPIIYENFIVWQGRDSLFLYDISSGKKEKLLKFPERGFYSYAIYENYLVLSYEHKIYLMDLVAKEWTVLIPEKICEESGDYYEIIVSSIYKNYLAYSRSCSFDTEIILYDINKGSFLNLTEETEMETEKGDPIISGDRVCWVDYTENAIICYHINKKEKIKFEIQKVVIDYLDIYEDMAVFSGRIEENGTSYIYMLNLESGESKKLGDGQPEGLSSEVKIYKNLVVWEKGDPSNAYLFDILTGKGRYLKPSKDENQFRLDIWGKYVIWVAPSGLDSDLFLCNIETGEVKQIRN